MIKPFLRLSVILAVAGIITSCSKYVADEVQEEEFRTANSTLTIKAAANAEDGSTNPGGEEAKISYPVNIYVFDSNSKCVSVSNIADENATVEMKLPEGQYDVYAVAGANADSYTLPGKAEASPESLIELKSGKEQGDIMTTHNNVILTEDGENKLTLNLERKVVLLQKIVINAIPADVENVSVTISPVYTGLKLDGSYTESTGSQTVQLTKNAENGVWTNASEAYILPSKGKPTITVTLQRATGSTSYSSSANEEFPANYKVNITGTYKKNEVTMSGTINGAKYQGTKDIIFIFDKTENPAPGENNPGTEEDDKNADLTVKGTVPTAGTEYNGCYVLSVSGNTATIIAPKEFVKLGFADDDYDAAVKIVNEKLKGINIKGLSNWRLATFDEIDYVYKNREEINDNIAKIKSQTKVVIDGFFSTYRFFFDDNGTLKQYVMNSTESHIQDGLTAGGSGTLRGFLTVKFVQ